MDPVAAKSSFLSMYMSSHKDTLASYVIYHGKMTNAKITNAEMIRIDSKVPARSRKYRPPCCLTTLSARAWTSATKLHPLAMKKSLSESNLSLHCLVMKKLNLACFL